MNFNKATVVMVLISAQIIGAGTAFAGFDFSISPSMTAVVSAAQASAPDAGVNTPALQIFHDKYVPDAIRKKYNLKDDWYGNEPSLSSVPENITWDDPAASTISAFPSPVAEPILPPADIVDTWRARKGENLRDVLQRWSARSGINLMWASVDSPVLQKDFSVVGEYQDAVNSLIREVGGGSIHSQYRAEGMSPVMTSLASTVTTNSPAPEPKNIAIVPERKNIFSKVFEPEIKQEGKSETRWFGLSGAPLMEVMKVWADDAGVDLLWQSEKNFALKNSVSQVGKFEDAIFQALSQYDGEVIRPVGEMYNDPKTGHRVLVVRTDITQE